MHSTLSVPVADGGEVSGSDDCSHPGAERHAWVTGPLGEKVNASWDLR